MRPTIYAALALGGLLALVSPAEAKPVSAGSKAAAHFTNPDLSYEEEVLCYDVGSRKWTTPEGAREDARTVATITLADYLRKPGAESTRVRGVALERCAIKEVSVPGGKAYEAVARACVSLRMYDPYTVDTILEDVDPQERQLTGHTFNGYTYMALESAFVTSNSSEGEYDKKVTKSKETTVVENYGVTNRALPWVAALSELLGKISFDDRQKGDVWKWAAKKGPVLERQGVKSMYERILPMYETLPGEMKEKKK